MRPSCTWHHGHAHAHARIHRGNLTRPPIQLQETSSNLIFFQSCFPVGCTTPVASLRTDSPFRKNLGPTHPKGRVLTCSYQALNPFCREGGPHDYPSDCQGHVHAQMRKHRSFSMLSPGRPFLPRYLKQGASLTMLQTRGPATKCSNHQVYYDLPFWTSTHVPACSPLRDSTRRIRARHICQRNASSDTFREGNPDSWAPRIESGQACRGKWGALGTSVQSYCLRDSGRRSV